MINISTGDIVQFLLGLSFIWFGIYLVSRNPQSSLSWTTFGFLASFGFSTMTNPILLHTANISDYLKWQKITDWPLFLAPIFVFHASLLLKRNRRGLDNILLVLGYLGGLTFYFLDIKQGYILNESVVRFVEYQRFDGFGPGKLLIPSIVFEFVFLAIAFTYYIGEIRKGLVKYLLPAIGAIILLVTAMFTAISFYLTIPWADKVFNAGFIISTFFFVFSMIKYHLFSPSEKIFDRTFIYKSLGILLIVLIYLEIFMISGIPMSFQGFVFINLLSMAVLTTHSFYDWVSTFINDLVYNPTAGLSIVNDQEVSEAIKNYNSPDRLESSSLLHLAFVKNKKKEKEAPVDGLREIIRDSIEYFKPEETTNRRTKRNLKYQMLKMIAYDQAEEGQILWELGFDEYPVRIMSHASQKQLPMFGDFSPANYTYTSRNAYLALKKEAIHDVTWRISYLEKQAKRKLFN